jgi:hypothetical protein
MGGANISKFNATSHNRHNVYVFWLTKRQRKHSAAEFGNLDILKGAGDGLQKKSTNVMMVALMLTRETYMESDYSSFRASFSNQCMCESGTIADLTQSVSK